VDCLGVGGLIPAAEEAGSLGQGSPQGVGKEAQTPPAPGYVNEKI